MVKPASEYNTEPVAEGFFAICHPDTRPNLEAIPEFVPTEKYANYGAVMAGEVGKVGMVRFIATTLATPDDDKYFTLVFAKDAVGCVSLAGKDSMTPTVVTPKATAEDPLGQRGSVGYQFWYTCKVLQDNWMVRIEHAVGDPV